MMEESSGGVDQLLFNALPGSAFFLLNADPEPS